jgi:hypothetical protein
MGHRSIQVTIDVYGRLIAGEYVPWIDTVDRSPQKRVMAMEAHQPHTQGRESEEEVSEDAQDGEGEEVIWLPPRDSNPDMLIQSQISPSENKEHKDLHSAKRDQPRQNKHTGRTRDNEDAS